MAFLSFIRMLTSLVIHTPLNRVNKPNSLATKPPMICFSLPFFFNLSDADFLNPFCAAGSLPFQHLSLLRCWRRPLKTGSVIYSCLFFVFLVGFWEAVEAEEFTERYAVVHPVFGWWEWEIILSHLCHKFTRKSTAPSGNISVSFMCCRGMMYA